MSPSDRYRAAGVDLDAADEALSGIADAVESTYTPNVLRGLGAFGGLFHAPDLPADPVLVASTDGVGTKTRVAAEIGGWRGIGRDLVHHCVNDVLVQGARPLFFLDYLASARLRTEVVTELVGGIADACRAAGMPLLGGETAEMPGVYAPGEVDVVGTIVGVASKERLLTGALVEDGDLLLGLPSGGLQTNGFSLARSALEGRMGEPISEDPDHGTIGDALLAEHRSFLPEVLPLVEAGLLHGAAHVTGGGLPGNLPRVLPEGLRAVLTGRWPEPPIFDAVRRAGGVSETEMRRVFNLGIGFVLVLSPTDADEVERRIPTPVHRIGYVERGSGVAWRAAPAT